MATGTTQPRYSNEEAARRADEIFERNIAARVSLEDENKFVVIDLETGDFEVDADEMAAMDRLHDRNPDAQLWLRRVGFSYAHRFISIRDVRMLS